MSFTVESIAQELALSYGEEYSDLDIKETWDTWTAHSIDEVLSEEWPFQYVTGSVVGVATQQVYVAPSGMWDISRVAEAGLEPLEQTSREDIIDGGYSLSLAGTPTHWFNSGVDTDSALLIGLWPVPSVSDTEYTVVGGTLTNVSAVLPTVALALPPDVVQLVRFLVKVRYYELAGNVEMMNSNHGRYLRQLPNVRKRHMALGDRKRVLRYNDVPTQVGGRFLRMPSNF